MEKTKEGEFEMTDEDWFLWSRAMYQGFYEKTGEGAYAWMTILLCKHYGRRDLPDWVVDYLGNAGEAIWENISPGDFANSTIKALKLSRRSINKIKKDVRNEEIYWMVRETSEEIDKPIEDCWKIIGNELEMGESTIRDIYRKQSKKHKVPDE